MKLVHLYNTTEYSFLNSLIRIEELVTESKKHNLKAVALTDHNNLFALGEFLKLCQKNEIKPIIGVDLDYEKENKKYRIILLAKNYLGYQLINKLILLKSQDQNLTLNDFAFSNDIFILDHPTLGYFIKEGEELLFSNKNYFIPSLDLEHSNGIYLRENKLIKKEDNSALRILQQIGNLEVSSNDYPDYFGELEIPQIIIERMHKIIDECNVIFPEKKLDLAHFNNFNELEANNHLINLINNALEKKQDELKEYKNWEERLKYEFEIIKNFKFTNYFLIIQDLIHWAEMNKIAVGPGRGSAAGSLVSYLLGITKINPLKYGLLFERFLNPGRLSWPDIDIDIQDDRRNEVFAYLKEKYGFENTALISTFQTIGAKMAIRDVARVLGTNYINNVEVNKISKTLELNASLKDSIINNLHFKIAIENYPELLNFALKIEGLPRQQGYHPAGLIISQTPINKLVPSMMSNDNIFQQVQLSMNYIEDYGLLKIDLLGLKTLTEISQIEQHIEPNLHFDNLIKQNSHLINDKDTFSMLNSGFTEGIFQLESNGMKSTVKKVKIDAFDDLYAIISLFRPGPKKYIDNYAESKNKNVKVLTIDPRYDEIVKNTFGIIVYQEQIMQIAQKVANMSFIEADFLRRAIGKKHEDEVASYQKIFVEGAEKNNVNVNIANQIYENIKLFGLYGFNKSHAVSYAYLTMKMAYYKKHYPLYFYNALISSSQGAQETIKKYVDEAKEMGFIVYSPNILYSSNNCQIINSNLYLPFNLIKGFGNEGINKILKDKEENGEYSNNIVEIFLRLRFAGLKDAALDTLTRANVFRDFGHIKYIQHCDKYVKDIYNLFSTAKSYSEVKEKIVKMNYLELNIYFDQEQDLEYEMNCENELLGSIYNVHLTSKYEKDFPKRLNNLTPGDEEWFVVEYLDMRKIKNKDFYYLKCKDSSREIIFYFSPNFYNYFEGIKKHKIVLIKINYKYSTPKIIDWKEVK
ncbi:DNA polymerase III subunit alpha [Mycoplasmopsis columbina]|uniref:DNA polymerase III subunit alpha n=1 Tax=Mycoplasmopsis columbina TaxID=114881 RepID=UPI0004A6C4EC|nr:DNA polymerase III subunit alpha [Mycoplasmopsis columbina]VEU76846.1 DNA polymerase III alpha subunit [Mycoplasmopsis columbina]